MYKTYNEDYTENTRFVPNDVDPSNEGNKFYFNIESKERAFKNGRSQTINKVYYNIDDGYEIDVRVRGDQASKNYSYMSKNMCRQDNYYNNSVLEYGIPVLNVKCNGTINGAFNDKYGIRGEYKINNMPLYSIPLTWTEGPVGTKSYAITLTDDNKMDSNRLPWVHWLVADIPAQITGFQENTSRHHDGHLSEGLNSYVNDYFLRPTEFDNPRVPNQYAIGYGGFTPIDKPHTYTVKVYALKCKLNLKPGFTYEQLLKAMDNKILAQGEFKAVYNN